MLVENRDISYPPLHSTPHRNIDITFGKEN